MSIWKPALHSNKTKRFQMHWYKFAN